MDKQITSLPAYLPPSVTKDCVQAVNPITHYGENMCFRLEQYLELPHEIIHEMFQEAERRGISPQEFVNALYEEKLEKLNSFYSKAAWGTYGFTMSLSYYLFGLVPVLNTCIVIIPLIIVLFEKPGYVRMKLPEIEEET